MASLLSIAKIVTGRLYPVLVWGALMGFAVHAGLKAQFSHSSLAAPESEQITLANESSARVKIPVKMEEDSSDQMRLL